MVLVCGDRQPDYNGRWSVRGTFKREATFVPKTPDIATCMYHTGIDPFIGEEVQTARNVSDRKLQRALLQFFKPENYFEVREALLKAGRADLIGGGSDALIPAQPPKSALRARMEKANRSLAEGRYVHTIDGPRAREGRRDGGAGYRPGRSSARRRPR